MGGVSDGKTLLENLAEAEILLHQEGFDSESDAIGEAIALLKMVDIDALVAKKLKESVNE